MNIEDHNCGMCGKQATKVHKSFPAPPRAIFICDDCADQKDYILDTLSPDLILSEEAQEKIKKRNYQKRHRYIKSNNIKLPNCQICASNSNVINKPVNIEDPFLVYRLCRSCEKSSDLSNIKPINIKDYS